MSSKTAAEIGGGGVFDFLDPVLDPKDLRAVVRGLAKQVRFSGNYPGFEHYSIAEHSCHVFDIVRKRTGDPFVQVSALLHDSPEGIMGDKIAPLKATLPKLNKIEKSVLHSIEQATQLAINPKHPVVLWADLEMLALEKRVVMQSPNIWRILVWNHVKEPKDVEIGFWSAEKAYHEFLDRLALLNINLPRGR